MTDKNKNGIDDKYEGLSDLADSLGVDAPTPEAAEVDAEDAAVQDVSRVFAGEIDVPLYDSGIRRESVGRIPVEQTRSQALAEFAAFSDQDRKRLEKIATSLGVDTKFSSLQWLWQQGVNNAEAAYAAGQRVTPWEYLESWATQPEQTTGAGTRGVGGYAGPRTTVTMASERDLRATADAVASTVLGRAVTDDEFQSVLEQVRSAERAEPTITTSGVGSTITQAGLTAEGRQNIITEALMQGPEAEDFGKATKMMDLFYSALEARPEGA